MKPVILERRFKYALDPSGFMQVVNDSVDCLPRYRVTWHESLLAEDGSRLLCRFDAPDTEAVRNVGRRPDVESAVAWAGTVHDSGREGLANVVVERGFAEPVTVAALQAIEDAGASCMELHRVTFLRTFVSLNGRRMLCLYQAPDAESVRLAQRQAGMPLERVWACRHYTMDNLPDG
jgi:hypothetical protein